jgi:hypothetical protein
MRIWSERHRTSDADGSLYDEAHRHPTAPKMYGHAALNMAERLVAADESAMATQYSRRRVLGCSSDARTRVEQYIAQKEREYTEAITQARVALHARSFAQASQIIAAYQSRQVNVHAPNPMAIKGTPRTTATDAAALSQIFRMRPKLLGRLTEEEWEPLHIVSGLNYLLGGRVSGDGLPDAFVGVPGLERSTIVLMMQFHFQHLRTIENLRSIGVTNARIMCCNAGSCAACMKLHDQRFGLDELPELPYAKCTSEYGCRCTVSAIIEGIE